MLSIRWLQFDGESVRPRLMQPHCRSGGAAEQPWPANGRCRTPLWSGRIVLGLGALAQEDVQHQGETCSVTAPGRRPVELFLHSDVAESP